MGISISNATSSAITKYSVSLRSGEPDWSMIPSAGKSNKSQAEFVSEIKELAQRAANTTSKTVQLFALALHQILHRVLFLKRTKNQVIGQEACVMHLVNRIIRQCRVSILFRQSFLDH